MSLQKIKNRIRELVQILQEYADRLWYPPFIGFLAALDSLVVVIPNDGILISSCMLTPRRWFFLALSVSIGSTLGALTLATIVESHGLPWILNLFPGINESPSWLWTESLFSQYGLLLVFAIAATPLVQQPVIILAGLAQVPLLEFTGAVFIGRFLKFLFMAYLGSHAPRLLGRLWGLKSDLRDAGVKLD